MAFANLPEDSTTCLLTKFLVRWTPDFVQVLVEELNITTVTSTSSITTQTHDEYFHPLSEEYIGILPSHCLSKTLLNSKNVQIHMHCLLYCEFKKLYHQSSINSINQCITHFRKHTNVQLKIPIINSLWRL